MKRTIEYTAVNHLSTLPKELWNKILSYLDVLQILSAQFVNKAWANIILELCNTNLFPQLFSEGELWQHLLRHQLEHQKKILSHDVSLLSQPFTQLEQQTFFHSYSKSVLNYEYIQGPLTFFERVKQIFIEYSSIGDNRNTINYRNNLFENRLRICLRYFDFLFDHKPLQHFTTLYDQENKRGKAISIADILFLHHMYQVTSELESFITTCAILAAPTSFIENSGNFFPLPFYKIKLITFLKGSDVVLLSQKVLNVPDMIGSALSQTLKILSKIKHFIPEEINTQSNTLLKKLTFDNLIAYISNPSLDYTKIVKAIFKKKSPIFTLFLKASDLQLRNFYFSITSLGLAILKQPLLVERLSNESLILIFNNSNKDDLANILSQNFIVKRLVSLQFLKDFDHDLFWKDLEYGNEDQKDLKKNRKLFVKFLLTIPKVIEELELEFIEALIVSYKLKATEKILKALVRQQKLSVPIFFKLLKNASFLDLKDEFWIFECAFQLASETEIIQNLVQHVDTDITKTYRLLQLALQSSEAMDKICPLLNIFEIITRLTKNQLQDLSKILSNSFHEKLNKKYDQKLEKINHDTLLSGPNYRLINHELMTWIHHKIYQEQCETQLTYAETPTQVNMAPSSNPFPFTKILAKTLPEQSAPQYSALIEKNVELEKRIQQLESLLLEKNDVLINPVSFQDLAKNEKGFVSSKNDFEAHTSYSDAAKLLDDSAYHVPFITRNNFNPHGLLFSPISSIPFLEIQPTALSKPENLLDGNNTICAKEEKFTL